MTKKEMKDLLFRVMDAMFWEMDHLFGPEYRFHRVLTECDITEEEAEELKLYERYGIDK